MRLLVVGLLFFVVGCARAAGPGRPDVHGHSWAVPGPGIRPGQVIVEPSAGVEPVVRAIDRARRLILVEAYIFTEPRVRRALERAEAQGVDVRVLLERHPFGMGTQPERAAALLEAAGVAVRWGRPDVQFTHAKFLVLDDRVAIVSTANLSSSGFSANREFLLVIRSQREVREISNIFRRDWDRLPATIRDPDLIVSPVDARSRITALIHGARTTVDIYSEEIADDAVQRLLITRARAGVRVRLILPSHTDGEAVHLLRLGGVAVRTLDLPYIHAKAIVADTREAYVGSVNLSTTSLDRNREVGILVRGGAVMRVDQVFRHDWLAAGKSRSGPRR